MNIYLDLEANAITQEIISIGAISEEGKEFYSLVKPHTNLDRKIKELTGISQADADKAPAIEQVMLDFHDWRVNNCGDGRHDFLVFGSCDRDFVRNTKKYTVDPGTLCELTYLHTNIQNVEKRVAKKFNREGIGLRSAYLTMRLSSADDIEKTHNALDDAAMLKWVWEHIDNYQLPAGVEVVKVARPNMSYRAAVKSNDPRLQRKVKIVRPAKGNRPEKEWIVKNANEAYGFLTHIDGAKKRNVIGKIIAACESGEKYRNRYFSFVD